MGCFCFEVVLLLHYQRITDQRDICLLHVFYVCFMYCLFDANWKPMALRTSSSSSLPLPPLCAFTSVWPPFLLPPFSGKTYRRMLEGIFRQTLMKRLTRWSVESTYALLRNLHVYLPPPSPPYNLTAICHSVIACPGLHSSSPLLDTILIPTPSLAAQQLFQVALGSCGCDGWHNSHSSIIPLHSW